MRSFGLDCVGHETYVKSRIAEEVKDRAGPTEPQSDAQLEIGHVLCMDIVGFSKLLVDEQRDVSNRLNRIVRETEQFRAAEMANKLIRLPTGDGMALVFYTGPEAPARCAIEISRGLKDSSFGLRMGIHSGPVNKVSDVNDRSNLTGTGINLAQRVMDCGDAGHILLSKRASEDLEQHSKWRPRLHRHLLCCSRSSLNTASGDHACIVSANLK